MSAIPIPFKGPSIINHSPTNLALEDDDQNKPPSLPNLPFLGLQSSSQTYNQPFLGLTTPTPTPQTTSNQPYLGLPTPTPTPTTSTTVNDTLKSLLVVMQQMKEEMTRNTNAVLSKVLVNSENITQIQSDNVVRDNKIADLQNQLNLLKEDKNVKSVNITKQHQQLSMTH